MGGTSQYLCVFFLRGFLGERLLDFLDIFFSFDFDLLRSLSLLLDRFRGDLDLFLSPLLSRFLSNDDLSDAVDDGGVGSSSPYSINLIKVLSSIAASFMVIV